MQVYNSWRVWKVACYGLLLNLAVETEKNQNRHSINTKISEDFSTLVPRSWTGSTHHFDGSN